MANISEGKFTDVRLIYLNVLLYILRPKQLIFHFCLENEHCKSRYGLGDCSTICLPTADDHVCTCNGGSSGLQDRHTCKNGIAF